MAGHRKAHGRPSREQSRQKRMADRIAAALTPEQRASAAFDALRMAARHADDFTAADALENAARYLIGLTAHVTQSKESR
jgi:hypothetical protein